MINQRRIDAIEQILVDALLPAEAKAQYAAGDIALAVLRPIGAAVKRLSERYVNRTEMGITTPEDARAYALYYTPINGAKVLRLLEETGMSVTGEALRILDYGCGPGTGSLAASVFFERPLEIVGVDNAGPMRDAARRVLECAARVRPLSWRIESDFSGEFDLIIAANVLNELPPSAVPPLFERFLGALAPGGRIVTIEPALQHTTRAHMGFRDAVLANHPDVAPLFPCTRRDPCPMLSANGADWCHGALRWSEPRVVRQLDEITGFNKHRAKYSAFVFARGEALRPGVRIVRDVEKTHRGGEGAGCGPGFYGPLILPKRNRTGENRTFQKLTAFERIEVSPAPVDGVIGPTAAVTIRS